MALKERKKGRVRNISLDATNIEQDDNIKLQRLEKRLLNNAELMYGKTGEKISEARLEIQNIIKEKRKDLLPKESRSNALDYYKEDEVRMDDGSESQQIPVTRRKYKSQPKEDEVRMDDGSESQQNNYRFSNIDNNNMLPLEIRKENYNLRLDNINMRKERYDINNRGSVIDEDVDTKGSVKDLHRKILNNKKKQRNLISDHPALNVVNDRLDKADRMHANYCKLFPGKCR